MKLLLNLKKNESKKIFQKKILVNLLATVVQHIVTGVREIKDLVKNHLWLLLTNMHHT